MAVISTDTFSGQSSGDLLENHVGEVGATWTKHGSASGNTKFDGSGGTYTDAVTPLHYTSGVPANADETASTTVTIVTVISFSATPTPCVRLSTSANTMYLAQYVEGTGLRLFKGVAGTFTQLGSTVVYTLVDQDVLQVSAVGTTIKLTVNGVDKITATDSAISAAGVTGIRGGNAVTPTTGFHSNNFNSSDTSTGSTFVPRRALMGVGI